MKGVISHALAPDNCLCTAPGRPLEAGEPDPLLRRNLVEGDPAELSRAFVNDPELHHLIRGRVRGRHEFMTFVRDQAAWPTRSSFRDARHVQGLDRVQPHQARLADAVAPLCGVDPR